MVAARPFKETDPTRHATAIAVTWRLHACQKQIHSLARQSEAITATQDAIFRGYGLNFWQGAKRYMRWEGDRRY
jgi:hypothetical protein